MPGQKADQKADEHQKADPKTGPASAADSKPAQKASLAPAGESSDPAVHQLLAERAGALLNRQALDVAEEDVKSADEHLADIDQRLADLGYTAS